MDTRTGDIYPEEELRKKLELRDDKELGAEFKRMHLIPTREQLSRIPTRYAGEGAIGRVGKYDPCPCGSGKKFKWCCFKREPTS